MNISLPVQITIKEEHTIYIKNVWNIAGKLIGWSI